jgi:hypothetical protein
MPLYISLFSISKRRRRFFNTRIFSLQNFPSYCFFFDRWNLPSVFHSVVEDLYGQPPTRFEPRTNLKLHARPLRYVALPIPPQKHLLRSLLKFHSTQVKPHRCLATCGTIGLRMPCTVDVPRVVDPHWFNADPDPAFCLIADSVPNPGFWWPKIKKKHLLNFFVCFWSNNSIYL